MVKQIFTLSLVLLSVSGCAMGMTGHTMGKLASRHHNQMGHMQPGSAITNTHMAGMNPPMATGDQPVDVQFIDSMIVHHQGAVTMANAALEQAEHPEVKRLATAIIDTQTKEISDMQKWRQAWYPTLPASVGMGMHMGAMTISADSSKPFDQRFLEAMISHHQGAIDMAKLTLQRQPAHAEIKTLAAAISAAQQIEIEQMQGWLKAWFGAEALPPSPYVAQLASPVRGLSAQEVADLQAGQGMGLARMAELNSYPGPRHVLDLQKELNLSTDQVRQIEAIFVQMQTAAQALGEQIVEREAALSTAFADRTINPTALAKQVQELTDLYGQLRFTHLQAHLQVTPLLTPDQIAHYNNLRGYTDGAGMDHGSMDHSSHP